MRQALTIQLPEAFPPVPLAARVVNGLVGLVCAGLILVALTLSRKTHEPAPEPEMYVAQQFTAPVEEPPPQTETTSSEFFPVVSPLSLEITPSADSAVRIQVLEIPLLAADHSPPSARAMVAVRFDLARSAMKPVGDDGDLAGKRIFSRHEVDQRPMALHRVTPQVNASRVSKMETPRTVMLLVVKPDGTVGEVRVMHSSQDADFDQTMMDTIREWRFSPAIRKGRKVSCWVEQAITVRVSRASPLEAN